MADEINDSNEQIMLDEAILKCKNLQIASWLEELKDIKIKYKAAVLMCADFDNYKKRMQRLVADTASSANKGIIEKLLNVIDDFDRVQEAVKTYESNPVIEGIKLVYSNFLKILSDEGCRKIHCRVGDKFDVNFHEAVAVLPHEPGQVNSGSIALIMQLGWTLNGNLLRAAKVIVRQ